MLEDDDDFWERLLAGEVSWPPAGSAEYAIREMELAARRCAGRGHAPQYLIYGDQTVVSAMCACGQATFVREDSA